MSFIDKLYPPKFLRYLFFISYSMYRRYAIERYNAHHTAILFIGAGLILFLFGLSYYIPIKFDTYSGYLILLIASLFLYVFFWHKQKWKFFLDEFKNVPKNLQKKHVIYLFIYLSVCLLFSFFPILIYEFFNIRF